MIVKHNPEKQSGHSSSDLRMRAEMKLGNESERLLRIPAQDTEQLVYELGTYQIELEMQNEELRINQQALESSYRTYADLYDFAPVGYFSFDRDGTILEANQAGAAMLGRPKRLLPGSPFPDHLLIKDRPVFKAHLNEVFRNPERRSCELRLKNKDGDVHVQIQSIVSENEPGSPLCTKSAVIDVTAGKIAEQHLERSHADLQAACTRAEESSRILLELQQAREDERSYIAHEIHDELGQMLTALSMDLSWIGKRYNKINALSEKVVSMTRILDMTIGTVQRITDELRPSLLEHLGLASAIKRHIWEFQKRIPIKCAVNIHPRRIALDKDRAIAIFRIFQEALANVASHADASEVRVTLKESEGVVTLEISDDGKGLTKKQIANPQTFGLRGIRESARSFGGKVTISGSGGKGTRLKVIIPANGDSEE